MRLLSSALGAHYVRVAPLLNATFGAIPIVTASYPDGLGTKPRWNAKGLPLVPHVLEWCIEKLNAVEFHAWTPSPTHKDRLGFARILLEFAGPANAARMREAALLTREALNALNLDAIAVLDGLGGMALFLPFDDAPEYAPVRAWLERFASDLATKHGDIFSTEPNTHGDGLIHIHVKHNAVRLWSVLPYSARGVDGYPIALPVMWSELGHPELEGVTIDDLPARLDTIGDVLAIERKRIGNQMWRAVMVSPSNHEPHPRVMVSSSNHILSLSKGHTIAAAMSILSDGVTRSAEEIFEEAVKRKLLDPSYKAKYVYTALIEYIARANGNGRKPYIIQDENRDFRINEPLDDWPNLAPPAPHVPDAAAQALADRLIATANGTDSTAFEVAVCDAFAHLGFAATHVGGNKAPDGYADALLGPLGYRVMIECKTAKAKVAQPDAFEAAKYRDTFHAQYCTLVGPAFPDEVELTQELHTHGVSAWTVDDLRTALLSGANAYELRPCFEPGYAADGITDLLWNRDHGPAKRVRVVTELICQVGMELQKTAAREGTPGDAPLLTVDTAMALVDQALAEHGSSQGCTREDVELAFEYLTNPIVNRADWTNQSKVAAFLTQG